jgi:hypothetical protein
MNLFGRNKKSEIAEKVSKNSKWNKDLKSNTVNKTGSTQERFEFNKRTSDSVSEDTGRKKGLRYFLKEITQDQIKILKNCAYENTAADLIKILDRTNKSKFKAKILKPLVTFGFFELTIPAIIDKNGKELGWSTSPKLKYRLTSKFVSKKVNS